MCARNTQTIYIGAESEGKEEFQVPCGRSNDRNCARRAGVTTRTHYAPIKLVGPVMRITHPVLVPWTARCVPGGVVPGIARLRILP